MIDFILRPLRRNFGEDKRYYRAVDDMFGFIPHNIELYKLALIHKSASVVLEDGSHINNERLEYLGDAVIESVTSEYLFIEFPDKNEGFLTQLRSKMVSRQTLNEVAKRIGLDDYVITHSSNNISQKHIYGDAFEAMMGAIYLDQGYEFVNRLLINHIFVKYIKVDNLLEEETDFKSRLIEWCQKNHHSIQFQTANDKTYSSAHPFFYSKVLIDGIEVGYGAGDSKKEAEQRASYSVSQGFSESDYTKIMDKLDNLEGPMRSKADRAKSKGRAPQTKANGVEPSTEVGAIEPKEEVVKSESAKQDVVEQPQAKTEESKPKRNPRQRRASKAKDSAVEVAESESVAQEVKELMPAAKKSAELSEGAAPVENKRRSRAKSTKQNKPIAEGEQKPDAESSVKGEEQPKAAKPRRRRAPKSEKTQSPKQEIAEA